MLNEDYKHLCSSSVPFTEFLFGNDADLSKQPKDLTEATKVSKKLKPQVDGHKSNGYRGYKHATYPTFGEHPDVKRFMKGIFQSRPPLPRYDCKTWDVNLVLQYICSMGNSQELSLKDLTLKLVMLVALTTAQRGQSLQLLDTQNMVEEETAYTFMLNSNLKQS